MFKAYTYILQCMDDRLYVGSTKDLNKRLQQHNDGRGSEFTRIRLPVELVYFEGFDRIDFAFYREESGKLKNGVKRKNSHL